MPVPSRTRSPIVTIAALSFLAVLVMAPAFARGLTVDDVAKVVAVTDAEISPDGAYVAFVRTVPRDPYADDDGPAWTELYVATAKGSSRPFVSGEVNVSSLGWTPDGAAVTYLAKRNGDEYAAVWSIPVDGGESRKIAGFETSISSYVISPDGKQIAFVATAKAPESEEHREKKGFKAKVIEEGLRPAQLWIATLKPDGAVGKDEARAIPLPGSASEVAWSPDGKRLSVALAPTPLVDDEYMKRKLHVVDLEGTVLARIENPGKLGAVRWSPDGSTLALISAADVNDPNASRPMVVPSAGGVLKSLLSADFEGDVEHVAWKDDATVVYVVDRGTGAAVAQIGVDGTGGRVLSATGGPIFSSLSLSDDGGIAALVADAPDHPEELFVLAEGAAERWTDSNPWLAEIDLAPQETIVWKARDGLEIEGVLIRPLGETAGARHPLIHVVHGGPEAHFSNGWMTSYSRPGQLAAADGYFVLHANYRGSTGRGVAFSKLDQGDYAGDPSGGKAGEFWDLVDGIEHLVAQGAVDRAKVGVTGGSYGGFASAWCATALTEHFAASVMFVGISDLVSKFGTTDIPNEMFLVHARRWPWEDWDWFRERSPIHYAEQARTPILILHGEDDTRVHPSQSMELFRYLKTIGKVPVRLVLYPGEGHGNRKAAGRYDYSVRLMRWMNHYLKGDGGDPPPYEIELDADRLGLDDDNGDDDGA